MIDKQEDDVHAPTGESPWQTKGWNLHAAIVELGGRTPAVEIPSETSQPVCHALAQKAAWNVSGAHRCSQPVACSMRCCTTTVD